MSSDPELLASLEAAIDRDPTNVALRVHIADLYLEGGEPDRALGHLEVVLAGNPAHRDAIALAARAAKSLGQRERASGFELLLAALDGAPSKSLPEEVVEKSSPAVPVADEGLLSGRALDEFLEEVLATDPDLDRPTVTLADVGGLVEVKKHLNTSFLGPMRNPELRRMYGTSLRGGLLLYGPPGCGKTFLARAVAGELGAHFFGVGLHEVLDMWLGQSERNLHQVFDTARRHAPCVLFMDEVDALG